MSHAPAFRRLSMFRGSFALDAAEAVTGADLDQLAALLDQSLLRPLGDDRLFLLETLREYARELLDDAGETTEYGLRHARHYLARLEEIEPVLRGPRTAEFIAWSRRSDRRQACSSHDCDAPHNPYTVEPGRG
ncbi:MAG: hypothetical protein ACXVY6_07630 [Gaiellaceae bacterium]